MISKLLIFYILSSILHLFYQFFFDDKNGFDDEYLTTFEKVLNYIFVLALHAKTTDDKSCESQITLLKNSVDKFIETILKK